MPRKKHLKAKVTHYPDAAVKVAGGRNAIDPDRWTILANDAWQCIITSINARQTLENNLELWYNLCDMTTGETDTPYVDSSNLFIPLVPSKIEALRDQVAAITFVPEFYLVTGLTPDASETAYVAQAYWNNEFRKWRGPMPTWFEAHMTWLHLALRDGTAIMEAMWRRQTRTARYGVQMPKLGQDGEPLVDDNGEVVHEVHDVDREIVEYNDVQLSVVKLKDFLLMPDESPSIRDAVGVCRCLWLYEDELRAMIADGLMVEEWVEKVLAYDPAGISDVAADRQRHYDKQIGNQLDIGMGQGVLSSEFFRNRGPFKIWRVHTRQYDLDNDGTPEENVLWVHDQSGYLLGVVPDEYIAPHRPFFDFSPFPRPDEFYGFSLAERLGPFNAEANLIWNQRNDTIQTRMIPPLLQDKSLEIESKGMRWGLGNTWAVNSLTGDIKAALYYPQMPDVPLASFQQESMVRNDADTIAGLNAPMTGGTNSGRRSATEVKISSASGSVRANQIAMLMRLASRSLLEFTRKLKLQYDWDPDPFGMPMTKETLAKAYKMDVSGSSDPLDKQASVDEALGAYNLLQTDRDIQQNAVHRYNLKRMVLERIGIPNIEAIIGSPDDAAQRQQQEEQQAQEAAQFQKMEAMAKIQQQASAHGQDPKAIEGGGQDQQQQGPPQGQQPGQPPSPNGAGALAGPQ